MVTITHGGIFMKICKACGIEKSWDDYYHTTVKGKPYTNPRCKACVIANVKQTTNKQLKQARERNRYNADKEKVKAYNKRWRANNLEYALERDREYSRGRYATLSEEKKKSHRMSVAKWAKTNPIKTRIKSHNRRVKLKGNGGTYTEEQWIALCNYYDNQCLSCKQVKPLTADHVLPVHLGGSNTIENIQPLCKTCNSKKGIKHIDYR